MHELLRRAAIFAALVFASGAMVPAFAQDVTLTAQDGALSIEGTLQGFDGEVYRILSAYGPLTVDAAGVICEGPACPSLTVTKAVIRIMGAAEPGQALLPPLFAAFAVERGLTFVPGGGPDSPAQMLDPRTGQVLAEMSFAAAGPDQARAALAAGAAELVLSQAPAPDANARALGTDALVAIVAPDNPAPRIASTALARVLGGEVANWSEVGGPNMPLVLHALAADSDLGQALTARIGKAVEGAVTHATMTDLAAAVAKDPWGIAVTGLSTVGGARVIDLTDSCGFPLLPTPLAVKSEDYPLTLPVFLETPPRRLPRLAREFLEFLALPRAQAAVEAAGYVGRGETRQPMLLDGLRLLNAIRGAGKTVSLEDLQKLAVVMDGAERSSLTFRFEAGGSTLDAQSRDNVAALALLMETGGFENRALILAGFSDGSGSARANMQLSKDRVGTVLAALKEAAPGLDPAALPEGLAFGGVLPIACDETAAGRRLNRRVELWLKPDFGAAAGAKAEQDP
jgi:phosphate transport system substrate-binding protein